MRISSFTGSREAWDGFVRSAPGATHCHLHGWKQVFETCFGHECPYLAAEQDGALVGVLPLVWVRSRLFGRFLVSMPFLNYGGPLGDRAAVRALVDAAGELAKRQGAHLMELRCRDEQPLRLPVSHRKITVLLDLPADPAKIMNAFTTKQRTKVRRALKEGVQVAYGTDQIDGFYRVFAAHMRDLGTPVLPRRFFQIATQVFADSALVMTAWQQDALIGCGAGFTFGSEFEINWSSVLRSHSRGNANTSMYYALMERCARNGIRLFNFGRCTPGSGTHIFKMQWNGREHPLWWYTDAEAGEAVTPNPDNKSYAWGPRLWKKLPVPVATTLGPFIARSIP